MGNNKNSGAGGDGADTDTQMNGAVIGVGVGLAAGFAAPLMAGVALSAMGFTSTGTKNTT